MNYSYEEYLEYINETYIEYKEDEKMSNKEAITRTFNEYDMLMEESETDKAIISITIAEILVSHSKIFNTFKNYMIETLSGLNFKLIEQEPELTQEQYIDLLARKKQVLKQLETKLSDYYPRVCWYYEELTNKVNKFFDHINKVDLNKNEIVFKVLQRFERDCKNTLSEKFIVYTTLTENLLKINCTQIEGIETVKQELQLFSMETIHGEQLVEEEKRKLESRIDKVLFQLNEVK
ncbi:Imm3 family immunity protein [Metabacillus fastidiosus]|uniref:Imm3 family immunity protein n=1 Tax=Metabacillus fastidiosus TaxID=1458 RepID=UPI002E1AB752|nr:Imm3 family immunity protein [Metabacillus fastidiosus]